MMIFFLYTQNPASTASIFFYFPHWKYTFLFRMISIKFLKLIIFLFKDNFEEHVVAFDADLIYGFKRFVDTLNFFSYNFFTL